MIVKFNIGYDHAIADVSAQELDAFAKVAACMQVVEYDYSDKGTFIKKAEKIRIGIEVLVHPIQIFDSIEEKDADVPA